MQRAWRFLLDLGSGDFKHDPKTVTREEARDIVKHFPLGGDLEEAAKRYAPEQLGKAEREADQLAQEAARESARADRAERAYAESVPTIPPDNLNIP